MKETKMIKTTAEDMVLAKETILSGGVVAIPTETVYGLAANAYDENAVKAIFEAKGRPQDNPLIVHIADMDMLEKVASEVPETAKRLADRFWSGPLTMVLPKNDNIPFTVTGGLDTVGVRMPSHPAAREFIRLCGVPLAAPSANVSGKPSPTTAEHVRADLGGKVEYIIDGGRCEVGVESTVVKVGDDAAEILRPGKITVNDLLEVVSTVTIDDGVFTKLGEDCEVSSPGMKYQHYSPRAHVTMVNGGLMDFYRYVGKHAEENNGVLVFEGEDSLFPNIPCYTYGKQSDSTAQAAKLFDALREIDQNDELTRVFARIPESDGVGLAVYNRLLRACGFDVAETKKSVVIGLTGQTGSGKTTISEMFRAEKSFGIIDCDVVSHDVITLPEVVSRLAGYFGEGILLEDGMINRRELGKIIFANEEDRISLNSVMYPYINQYIRRDALELHKRGYRYIVLDAPTLFESGADLMCDTIVSVLAPAEIRKERIMARDNLSETDALNRMNAQHDDAFYRERSEFIIENHVPLEALQAQTMEAIKAIKEKLDGGGKA